MLQLLTDYLDRLTDLHGAIGQAIDGLPSDALEWSPGPNMNSLTVLVTHTAGSERYWIGDLAGEDPCDRIRSAEFEARGADATSLRAHLDETLAHSERILAGLNLEDLEASRLPTGEENEITVAWALLHALEHTAIHLGHIEITRQLWEQREHSPT